MYSCFFGKVMGSPPGLGVLSLVRHLAQYVGGSVSQMGRPRNDSAPG
jgi:hypothetical protein